jgi:hypothetical protein
MTDPSDSPQTLLSPANIPFSTRHVFRQGAERLVRVMEGFDSLDQLCDWSIESGWDDGDVYLVHPVVRRSSRDAQHAGNADHLVSVDENESTEEVLWSDESVIDDPDVVVKDLEHQIESSESESEWNFSIVYSETWRVPVLYFRVQQRDGTPCSRNHVLEVLAGDSHQNQVRDSWDFVSHEEHPISRCPSFFLHPCRTQERLETLQASTSDEALRLLSWMSMIFPSVGYSISSRTFQQLRDRLVEDD